MSMVARSPQFEPVQALLAEALQVPVEQITPDLTFGGIRQWDSMGHMEVMLRLEARYGVEVTADTIATLVSVPAICEFLAISQKE